jgi:hypothetical protein
LITGERGKKAWNRKKGQVKYRSSQDDSPTFGFWRISFFRAH